MKQILINIPNFNLPGSGGVSALYKTLELNQFSNIQYFVLHGEKREKHPLSKLFRLLFKFCKFFIIVSKFRICILNPSLDKKSFYRDLVFLSLAKLRGVKTIIFWHGWNENFEQQIKHSSFKNCLFRKIYGKADAYIVLGTIFKEKLIDMGVVPDKKFSQYTNVADDRYLKNTNFNFRSRHKESINLLFLSRIERSKGIYLAIDIFCQLTTRIQTPIKFTIAGDGSELEEIKKFALDKNLTNIVFTGRIVEEEKHKALMDADIFLFPTFYGEGLPISILEAMLYGLPIVTRPVGGIPDILINDENGFLIESLDILDFVKELEKLIIDTDLYNRISLNNLIKGKENFTIDKARQKYLDIVLSNFS